VGCHIRGLQLPVARNADGYDRIRIEPVESRPVEAARRGYLSSPWPAEAPRRHSRGDQINFWDTRPIRPTSSQLVNPVGPT
jgi:hypothetical protein